MKLDVNMSADDTTDMGLFIEIGKVSRDNFEVSFNYDRQYEHGIVALGWLPASHRELDSQLSAEWQLQCSSNLLVPVISEPKAAIQ
jgi:uncharacterized protein